MNSAHKVISTLVKSGAALLLCLLFLQVLIGSAATAAPSQQADPDDANVADDTAKATAVGTTFNVTSPNCAGPGSISEAIQSAEANPGPDTISIAPSLQIGPINSSTCGTALGDPADFYLG